MMPEYLKLSEEQRAYLVTEQILPVLDLFLLGTHFVRQRVELAALIYIRTPHTYPDLLDKLQDLAMYAQHFTMNGPAKVVTSKLATWTCKLTGEVPCVCDHGLSSHEPPADHGKCFVAGCACGPGCIHEGFVSKDV